MRPPASTIYKFPRANAWSRINAIVKGRRAITAETDLRLCRFFGLSEGFWQRMQGSPDLKQAKQALESVLAAIVPIPPMA